MTADTVVKELAGIGFSDIRDYAEWSDGGFRIMDSAAIPEDTARAIKSFKERTRTVTERDGRIVTTTEREIVLYDKQKSLGSLGRHLGLFVDRVQLDDATLMAELSAYEHLDRGLTDEQEAIAIQEMRSIRAKRS